jgi:hypothetical protein
MHYIVWRLQQQNLKAKEGLVPLNLEESSRYSAAMVSVRSRLPMAPAQELDKEHSASDREAEEEDDLISVSEVQIVLPKTESKKSKPSSHRSKSKSKKESKKESSKKSEKSLMLNQTIKQSEYSSKK